MKTIGMLSGTETIAQKFESGPMAHKYRSRLARVNVRQPVARAARLLDRSRSFVSGSVLSSQRLATEELNAGRESRDPRSRERTLHLVEARSPLPRGMGRHPHLLRRRGRRHPA